MHRVIVLSICALICAAGLIACEVTKSSQQHPNVEAQKPAPPSTQPLGEVTISAPSKGQPTVAKAAPKVRRAKPGARAVLNTPRKLPTANLPAVGKPRNAPTKSATPRPPARKTPPAPADVAKPPANAQLTPSGLASKVLKKGTGTQKPTATSTVRVHYSGWTTDGKGFDSSLSRGKPAEFPLNAVIKGWTEGLQLMVPGEKRRFWIPEKLAYKGQPGKPAGMLVFDVELLEILK